MTHLYINAPWHSLHGTYTFVDRNDKAILKYMEQVAKDKKALVGRDLPKKVRDRKANALPYSVSITITHTND
jgi:hypothetical protein